MIAIMAEPQDDSYPTRSSLLRRVKDTEDQPSWREFNDIYGKLILGFAIKAGLTEDEAQEVVQETMIAAAKNLPSFRYDPKVCSFKTWLLNLSNWRVQDQLRKRQAPSAPRPAHGTPENGTETGTRTATVELYRTRPAANWKRSGTKNGEQRCWRRPSPESNPRWI